MILQIVADAWRIQHDLDAVLAQQVRRTDTRKLQQLRRIERSARDQNFLARPRRARNAGAAIRDGNGATSLEQDSLGER